MNKNTPRYLRQDALYICVPHHIECDSTIVNGNASFKFTAQAIADQGPVDEDAVESQCFETVMGLLTQSELECTQHAYKLLWKEENSNSETFLENLKSVRSRDTRGPRQVSINTTSLSDF